MVSCFRKYRLNSLHDLSLAFRCTGNHIRGQQGSITLKMPVRLISIPALSLAR